MRSKRRRGYSPKRPVASKKGRVDRETQRTASRCELVLQVVRQDITFTMAQVGGQQVWAGRCLHCRSKLIVRMDGSTGATTTVEHIVPQHHGGTNSPDNLALACRRCNHLKGARIDRLDVNDPSYLNTVAKLRAERRRRLSFERPQN